MTRERPRLNAARALAGSKRSREEIASRFSALADGTRLGILLSLGAGEMCVTDLVRVLDVPMNVASTHLRILKAHQLVRRRALGKHAFYTLSDPKIVRTIRGLVALEVGRPGGEEAPVGRTDSEGSGPASSHDESD